MIKMHVKMARVIYDAAPQVKQPAPRPDSRRVKKSEGVWSNIDHDLTVVIYLRA